MNRDQVQNEFIATDDSIAPAANAAQNEEGESNDVTDPTEAAAEADTSIVFVGEQEATPKTKQIARQSEEISKLKVKVRSLNIHTIGLDVNQSSHLVIEEVSVFWQNAQIPTSVPWYCAQKVTKLYEKWEYLQKISTKRSEIQEKREKEFIDNLDDLFDIAADENSDAMKKITKEAKEFLIAQRKKGREGCLLGVDVKGQKKEERKQERADTEERRRRKAEAEKAIYAKKTAAEAHRMLSDTYGEQAPSERSCREWFHRFKSGDFDMKDKERSGRPEAIEDVDLQALLDEDPTQTQKELALQLNVGQTTIFRHLHAMGKIRKLGKWVPHQLSEEQLQARIAICTKHLAEHKRNSFLYRIVTGDEKWVYYENPKRKNLRLRPGAIPTVFPIYNQTKETTANNEEETILDIVDEDEVHPVDSSTNLKRRLDAEIESMKLAKRLKTATEKNSQKDAEIIKLNEKLRKAQEENANINAQLEKFRSAERNLNWYAQSDINGDPGILAEAITTLKKVADDLKAENKRMLVSLAFDEISIKRHIQWLHDQKKFSGFATDQRPNEQDEYPVATYYCIHSLTAMNKRILLTKVLTALHEVEVKVVNITFDGDPDECETSGPSIFKGSIFINGLSP
ncbi:centrosomal protein of 290 kDa-like [Sitodiplosis mosellana]|uniref:centrosomal protein of 290 kDa-like n=1 Tax=Sitodiplosis mosellana TaxID=263140 RepID=UPI002443E271|nr:centrosomal protein of 290 kDa-like [Sitodiplosis mosellana]